MSALPKPEPVRPAPQLRVLAKPAAPPVEIISYEDRVRELLGDAAPAWIASRRQRFLLKSPVFEILAWGNRGGGKSEWLLADFLQDVGKGLGADWRGLILRREYKDLADIVERSKKIIPKAFPDATFHASPDALGWTFATGEKLIFRHAKRPEHISQFLGQEWPWLGFDELCNWSTPDLYLDIISSARSSNPAVRPRIRSATNPWGPGAWWVKARFIDVAKQGEIIRDKRTLQFDGEEAQEHIVTRAHVRIDFRDNPSLRAADPGYLARVMPSDPAKRAAWIEARWDLSVGGFFSGVWNVEVHTLAPFTVPSSWRIDRAHDWGATSPHCTLWFAESDGSRVEIEPGVWYAFPKGTLFVIAEIYGWNGEPNKGRRDSDFIIASDIKEVDGIVSRSHGNAIVRRGVADTQIFDAPQGKAIIDTYRRAKVDFDPADKSAGSRVTGAKAIMDRLCAAEPFGEGRPMEEPGLFIFNTCKQTIRTLPLLQRDEKNPDDIDSTGEDHAYDPLRYRALASRNITKQGRF